MFHGSGADFAIWHTTPALVPTLHPLPLGPGLAVSRGKSMEPEFLESGHLPDNLRGVLLKNTYFTSQIQLYRLQDDGAGFRSTHPWISWCAMPGTIPFCWRRARSSRLRGSAANGCASASPIVPHRLLFDSWSLA